MCVCVCVRACVRACVCVVAETDEQAKVTRGRRDGERVGGRGWCGGVGGRWEWRCN